MAQLPMKTDVHVRETAQKLKQHFLDSAGPIVQAYIDAALGKKDFDSINSGAREEVWDVMKKLMLQSSDKLELEIASAQDVIDAVSKGKCTFEEGEKLLNLYHKVKQIETQGQLDGTGGLTINILSTTQSDRVEAIDITTEAGHIIENGEVKRE